MRVDASLTAIIVVVVVVVVILIVVVVVVYHEFKANWYRDISQRLPPLSADCALAVVYLWLGYYRRPATQDLEMGVPSTPCRAAVPLRYAKQTEDLSSPSAIPREPPASEREKSSPALSYVSSWFSRFSRGWFDTRDNKDTTFIALPSCTTQVVSTPDISHVWRFLVLRKTLKETSFIFNAFNQRQNRNVGAKTFVIIINLCNIIILYTVILCWFNWHFFIILGMFESRVFFLQNSYFVEKHMLISLLTYIHIYLIKKLC